MFFIVMLVVGSASFCALGLAVTPTIPNADSSAAIVNATILPLLFLSGVFIPIGDHAPAWIVWVEGSSRFDISPTGCRPGSSGRPFIGTMS